MLKQVAYKFQLVQNLAVRLPIGIVAAISHKMQSLDATALLPSVNAYVAVTPVSHVKGKPVETSTEGNFTILRPTAFIAPCADLNESLPENRFSEMPESTLDALVATKVHVRTTHVAADVIDIDDLGMDDPFTFRTVGGDVCPSTQRRILGKNPFPVKAFQMAHSANSTVLELTISRTAQPPISTERSSNEGLLPWLAGQGSVLDDPSVDKWIRTAADVMAFEEMDCRGIWATVIDMEIKRNAMLAAGHSVSFPAEIMEWFDKGAYVDPAISVASMFAKAVRDERNRTATPGGKGSSKGSRGKGKGKGNGKSAVANSISARPAASAASPPAPQRHASPRSQGIAMGGHNTASHQRRGPAPDEGYAPAVWSAGPTPAHHAQAAADSTHAWNQWPNQWTTDDESAYARWPDQQVYPETADTSGWGQWQTGQTEWQTEWPDPRGYTGSAPTDRPSSNWTPLLRPPPLPNRNQREAAASMPVLHRPQPAVTDNSSSWDTPPGLGTAASTGADAQGYWDAVAASMHSTYPASSWQ